MKPGARHAGVGLVVGCVASAVLLGCGAPRPPGGPASGAPAAPSPGTQAITAPAAPPAPTAELRLDLAGGRLLGSPSSRFTVVTGTIVRIAIRSDRGDELHVHGYDRALNLTAGRPDVLEFVADAPGVFEIELHGSDQPLPRLEVR